jgi:hypothetical protein
MKKKLALALATFLVVGAVAATAASASGPTIVDSGFACNVFDGNGNLFVTTNSTLTVYDSGKVVLKCNGNGAGAPSLTFFNYDNTGVTCGMLQYGSTTDWSNKVGYNGNSQLTCTTFVSADAASASGGSAGIG